MDKTLLGILENFGNIWASIQDSRDNIEVIKKDYNRLIGQACPQLEEYYTYTFELLEGHRQQYADKCLEVIALKKAKEEI